MLTPTPLTAARTFAQLADEPSPAGKTWVRARRLDGTWLEGELARVESTQIAIVDTETGLSVTLAADDVAALDVREPRRGREWILAGGAIVAATVVLVAYSMVPGVNPNGGMTGFVKAMFWAGGVALSVLLARTRLRQWLTEWRALYPPPG